MYSNIICICLFHPTLILRLCIPPKYVFLHVDIVNETFLYDSLEAWRWRKNESSRAFSSWQSIHFTYYSFRLGVRVSMRLLSAVTHTVAQAAGNGVTARELPVD